MDIFAGLDELGLGGVKIDNIYAEPETEKRVDKRINNPHNTVINEADILFDKSYVCPACDSKFKSKTLRTGKYRLVGTDEDLRPRYDIVEPLKYEVVLCNSCGFAATSRYFVNLAPSQKKLIKEKISANYKPQKESTDTYSYEEALAKYKLALLNSVIKISHASEKAYNCLKAGWLVRGYVESLESEPQKDIQKITKMKALEDDFLSKAYEGLLTAMEQEQFPICGMDEYTLKYLLAVLAKRFAHYDVSEKLISDILVSKICSSRIKDRARDIKDELLKLRKA